MFCHQMSNSRHTVADEPFFLVRTLCSTARDGERVAPHAHAWPQLIVPVRGVLTVWTAVGSWVIPPGSAVWAPPGISHAWRSIGAVELRSLYFRPAHPAGPLPQATGVIAVSPLLRELISRSIEIGMLDERVPTHRAIAVLISDALSARNTPAFELPMPRSPELRALAESRRSAPHSPTTFAASAGISLRTLERRFSAETGMSLGRWLRHARLIDSVLALADGSTVASVARRAGYSTPSAFVAAFSSMFGTTPGRFFENNQSPPGG
jgi:AraC-like DNA-binding protein